MQPGGYAEVADAPQAQPAATHPAIVDVFAARRDKPQASMKVVGDAVVGAFRLADGNVVVRLRDAAPTHVYWGG